MEIDPLHSTIIHCSKLWFSYPGNHTHDYPIILQKYFNPTLFNQLMNNLDADATVINSELLRLITITRYLNFRNNLIRD